MSNDPINHLSADCPVCYNIMSNDPLNHLSADCPVCYNICRMTLSTTCLQIAPSAIIYVEWPLNHLPAYCPVCYNICRMTPSTTCLQIAPSATIYVEWPLNYLSADCPVCYNICRMTPQLLVCRLPRLLQYMSNDPSTTCLQIAPSATIYVEWPLNYLSADCPVCYNICRMTPQLLVCRLPRLLQYMSNDPSTTCLQIAPSATIYVEWPLNYLSADCPVCYNIMSNDPSTTCLQIAPSATI